MPNAGGKLPVRGEDDAPALASDISQDIPQVAASVGVHSSGGLILHAKQLSDTLTT